MKTKYIQSESHLGISGFYYFTGDIYYKNISATGKVIVLVKPEKGKNHGQINTPAKQRD